MKEQFGLKLRQLREAAGLSQPELAKASGVKQSAISSYERGTSEPSWSRVVALCKALKVSCEAFLDGTVAVAK